MSRSTDMALHTRKGEGPGIHSGFRPREGAWDCHCHIFGPNERFPYAAGRSYTPADVPATAVTALHRHLGFDHAVLVQPAAHGTDHTALLDGLARAEGRYRGVMLVKGDTSDLLLADLHRQGIRGVRYNLMPHLGPVPDLGCVRAVAERIAPLGWHICIHLQGESLPLLDHWLDLGVPLVIDHMARLDLAGSDGTAQADRLLALLGHDGIYVKLSAPDRISLSGPPYGDAIAIARRLLEAASERCLWGTDFPHPNHRSAPDDGLLVGLIPQIAPDAASRKRLLIENPRRLYA